MKKSILLTFVSAVVFLWMGYRIDVPETILNIEGYGECVVLDRMNRRFAHRVDIAMREDEVDRALEFGIQRRQVEVKPGRP